MSQNAMKMVQGEKQSAFENFTNKYSLSKTLRFELKPVGETLENMRKCQYKDASGKIKDDYDVDLQTFLHDQEIEDGYQKLKPLVDDIHEEFINDSLESPEAKSIAFSDYCAKKIELSKFQKKMKGDYKKEISKEDEKLEKGMNDELKDLEKKFRDEIARTFVKTGENWKKEKYKQYEWKKGSKVAEGPRILETQDVLQLAKERSAEVGEEAAIARIVDYTFKGFFTYFGGFNQNRANYYTTKDEKKTAVATRIVHENLPRFCDNIASFESGRDSYLRAYDYLKQSGKDLIDRDKKPLHPISDSVFLNGFFNECLSQKQIESYNAEIGNANFLINLYNQNASRETSFKKLSKFKTLYKQIGCGKRDALFFELVDERREDAEKRREGKCQEENLSVEDMIDIVKDAGKKYFVLDKEEKVGLDEFLRVFDEKKKEGFAKVFWSKKAINTISSRYFANWHFILDAAKGNKSIASFDKNRDEQVKIKEAVELSELFAVLDGVAKGKDEKQEIDWKKPGSFFRATLTETAKDDSLEMQDRKKSLRNIVENSEVASEALIGMILSEMKYHAERFISRSSAVERLTQEYFLEEGAEKEGTRKLWKEGIKSWMEEALAVQQMIKYFVVKDKYETDADLDEAIKSFLSDTEIEVNFSDKPMKVDWFKWYDALRNFLTKKPQDDAKKNKLKLNFNCPYLLGGWSSEYGTYDSLLIQKNNHLYLAIVNGVGLKENDIRYIESGAIGDDYARRFLIQTQKIDNKNPPRWFIRSKGTSFSPMVREGKINLTKEILDIYDAGLFRKKKDNSYKEPLRKLIDYFKEGFKKHPDFSVFRFSWKDSSKYDSIADFYNHTASMCYQTNWIDTNFKRLAEFVKSGKVYLFEIKNQDSNDGKKIGHKENLHTMYWKIIFEDKGNRPKLNGSAEIFYRKALSKDKVEKLLIDGKEIIKNYRFSKERFTFHVPVTLNFCLGDEKITDSINEFFPNNPDTQFLGIDRGEKHLAYSVLIDSKGNIVEQRSLNAPFFDKDGKPRAVRAVRRFIENGNEKEETKECWDYNDLLDARAGDRDYARKNWQTINSIKDLKNGYVSQVIHPIVKAVTDQPTFVVLEKLNVGFMRGRQKIEKSVYQKFETALAKKLNFVVDKEANIGEIGSVTKALQLTPPVQNFQDIEKASQWGVMLYVRADYTSQTDPKTGWRRTIYLKGGSEELMRKDIFEKFSDIFFDGKDYVFEYDVWFDENDRGKDDALVKKTWHLYSGKDGVSLPRFSRERNADSGKWDVVKFDSNEKLNQLFEKFDKSRSILEQLRNGTDLIKIDTKHTAWDSLRYVIHMIQQIRNTGKKSNESMRDVDFRDSDFLFSPVRDENGNHFDSRVQWDIYHRVGNSPLPICGDANGAYNIARKGIIAAEHIKIGLKPYISDWEWDAWLAEQSGQQGVWKRWLENNKKQLTQSKKK